MAYPKQQEMKSAQGKREHADTDFAGPTRKTKKTRTDPPHILSERFFYGFLKRATLILTFSHSSL
jgi:hypothetical protein